VTARRSISAKERARLFLLHGGTCHLCGGKINGAVEAWEISHDLPLALGGDDDDANRLLAHAKCHRARTSDRDVPMIAKADRQRARHLGLRPRPTFPGGKASKWKRKVSGEVVERNQR